MTKFLEQLSAILALHNIVAESMDKQEIRSFQKSWLQTFVTADADLADLAISRLRKQGLKAVRETVGKGWIVGINGAAAEDAYMGLPAADFVCWEPFDVIALVCHMGPDMPSFASMPCGKRTTVTSPDLKWTATLPGVCCAGQAFFARADWQPAVQQI